jgi:hypothetical protein
MDDLNTVFTAYLDWLRDESLLADLDSTTLVAKDQPTVRTAYPLDVNTAYAAWEEPIA